MDAILTMQRAAIAAELVRLEAARAQLPLAESTEWAGGAATAYALCLAKLHSDVSAALDLLAIALAESSRAIATAARQ